MKGIRLIGIKKENDYIIPSEDNYFGVFGAFTGIRIPFVRMDCRFEDFILPIMDDSQMDKMIHVYGNQDQFVWEIEWLHQSEFPCLIIRGFGPFKAQIALDSLNFTALIPCLKFALGYQHANLILNIGILKISERLELQEAILNHGEWWTDLKYGIVGKSMLGLDKNVYIQTQNICLLVDSNRYCWENTEFNLESLYSEYYPLVRSAKSSKLYLYSISEEYELQN